MDNIPIPRPVLAQEAGIQQGFDAFQRFHLLLFFQLGEIPVFPIPRQIQGLDGAAGIHVGFGFPQEKVFGLASWG